MQQKSVAIAWEGLPHYAAAVLAAGIARIGRPVPVIATPPSVPVEGVEQRLGQRLHLVSHQESATWQDLGLEVPELFFQTGWAYPAFNLLGEEVRKRGGRVVIFVDNNWKNTARQWLGAVYYRLFLRRRFAGVWVPGRSSYRFMRFLGVPPGEIYQGLNGADPDLYSSNVPLTRRKQRFLFVGQLIHRKGVDLLLEAFRAVRQRHPEWTLHFIGNGPYFERIKGDGISVEPFQQVDAVARAMADSRFLVLPAREEHWGMVAHEAALAGCGLVLSDLVGALPDLTNDNNCYTFSFQEKGGLERALLSAAAAGPKRLEHIQKYSLAYAALFGPETFADTFERIVDEV